MFFSYRCNAKNVPTGLGLEVLGLSDYVGQERAEHGVHTTGIDESGQSLRGQGSFSPGSFEVKRFAFPIGDFPGESVGP